jgi:hypothetical protein
MCSSRLGREEVQEHREEKKKLLDESATFTKKMLG